MNDRRWLPDSRGCYRLIYELDQNHLIVQMASPAHDAAANAWNGRIGFWSTNGGGGADTLLQLGQAGMSSLISKLTSLEWTYASGSQKSPDQSFLPINLTAPPGLVIPGTISLIFPTMVLEISKTHESYLELFDDADNKHFSPQTTVRIWVGVKLSPGHGGRMRAMFRQRDPVNHGTFAGSGATTGFIPLNQPTNIEFIIPKTEIYWGVVPPLPPTPFVVPGAAALPPPQSPGIATDDLVLPLEAIRFAARMAW